MGARKQRGQCVFCRVSKDNLKKLSRKAKYAKQCLKPQFRRALLPGGIHLPLAPVPPIPEDALVCADCAGPKDCNLESAGVAAAKTPDCLPPGPSTCLRPKHRCFRTVTTVAVADIADHLSFHELGFHVNVRTEVRLRGKVQLDIQHPPGTQYHPKQQWQTTSADGTKVPCSRHWLPDRGSRITATVVDAGAKLHAETKVFVVYASCAGGTDQCRCGRCGLRHRAPPPCCQCHPSVKEGCCWQRRISVCLGDTTVAVVEDYLANIVCHPQPAREVRQRLDQAVRLKIAEGWAHGKAPAEILADMSSASSRVPKVPHAEDATLGVVRDAVQHMNR